MKFKQKQPVVQTAINNALSDVVGGTSANHSIRIIVVQID